MATISLTQGKVAIVDDKDFEWLNQFKWYAMRSTNNWYASRVVKRFGNQRSILMHREITRAPVGMDVDHINHDGLDNQRSNLRVCTRSENLANQSAKPNNTSGRKGVSWDARTKKWIAFISQNNKTRNLGRFGTIEEAHVAYSQEARNIFGEFARTE